MSKRTVSSASISWNEREERNEALNAVAEVSMEQTKRRHIQYKAYKKQGLTHKEAIELVASNSRKEDGIQESKCPICGKKVLDSIIEDHASDCVEKQTDLLEMGFDENKINKALRSHEGDSVADISNYLCDAEDT